MWYGKRALNMKWSQTALSFFSMTSAFKPSTAGYIAMKVLYPEYQKFCMENGYKPVNCLNFKNRLEKSKVLVKKQNIGLVAYITRSFV